MAAPRRSTRRRRTRLAVLAAPTRARTRRRGRRRPRSSSSAAGRPARWPPARSSSGALDVARARRRARTRPRARRAGGRQHAVPADGAGPTTQTDRLDAGIRRRRRCGSRASRSAGCRTTGRRPSPGSPRGLHRGRPPRRAVRVAGDLRRPRAVLRARRAGAEVTAGDPIRGVPPGRRALPPPRCPSWRAIARQGGAARSRRRRAADGQGPPVDGRPARHGVRQLPLRGRAAARRRSSFAPASPARTRVLAATGRARPGVSSRSSTSTRRPGARRTVTARAVVVAAGAIDSTVLLLRSTLGRLPRRPRQHAAGSSARYLHDHPREWWPATTRPADAGARPPGLHRPRPTGAASAPLMATSLTIGLAQPLQTAADLLPRPADERSACRSSARWCRRPDVGLIVSTRRAGRSAAAATAHHAALRRRRRSPTSSRRAERFAGRPRRAGIGVDGHRAVPRAAPGSSVHYGGSVRMHAESGEFGVLDRWNRHARRAQRGRRRQQLLHDRAREEPDAHGDGARRHAPRTDWEEMFVTAPSDSHRPGHRLVDAPPRRWSTPPSVLGRRRQILGHWSRRRAPADATRDRLSSVRCRSTRSPCTTHMERARPWHRRRDQRSVREPESPSRAAREGRVPIPPMARSVTGWSCGEPGSSRWAVGSYGQPFVHYHEGDPARGHRAILLDRQRRRVHAGRQPPH